MTSDNSIIPRGGRPWRCTCRHSAAIARMWTIPWALGHKLGLPWSLRGAASLRFHAEAIARTEHQPRTAHQQPPPSSFAPPQHNMSCACSAVAWRVLAPPSAAGASHRTNYHPQPTQREAQGTPRKHRCSSRASRPGCFRSRAPGGSQQRAARPRHAACMPLSPTALPHTHAPHSPSVACGVATADRARRI